MQAAPRHSERQKRSVDATNPAYGESPMNRKLITALAIAGCVAVLLAMRNAPAEESSKADSTESARIGKGVILLSFVHGSGVTEKVSSDLLTDARLVKVGNRYFVKAKGVVHKKFKDDPRYNWFQGVETFHALDTVAQINDFTPEQLVSYMEQF